MEILVISVAAFLTAILTFFSGFGLGTILTPVFAIFFPIELAIALTGVVHFLNNIFKLVLIGRHADWNIALRFGIPAVIAAFAGAFVLLQITDLPDLFSYSLGGKVFTVTPVGFTVAILILVFTLMDVIPFLKNMQFGKDKMIIGGLLSGFFGGLSGNQGALRSAFLVKSGLSKEAFIATGIVIACFIDLTRLTVYATRFMEANLADNIPLLVSATLSAFAGAYLGSKLLKKVTFKTIQATVTAMLILLALALGMGLI